MGDWKDVYRVLVGILRSRDHFVDLDVYRTVVCELGNEPSDSTKCGGII
jgi:hypothetical protein